MAKEGDIEFPSIERDQKFGPNSSNQAQTIPPHYHNGVDSPRIERISTKYMVKEIKLPLIPQTVSSTSTSFADATNSLLQVNFDDWLYYSAYLEITGRTQSGTGAYQIYNITDSKAVELSIVAIPDTSNVVKRSVSLVKPVGTKKLKLQLEIVGGTGGDSVTAAFAFLVFRINI